MIDKIKEIFNYKDSFANFPRFITDQIAVQKSSECEKVKLQEQFDDLNLKFDEITKWKS